MLCSSDQELVSFADEVGPFAIQGNIALVPSCVKISFHRQEHVNKCGPQPKFSTFGALP